MVAHPGNLYRICCGKKQELLKLIQWAKSHGSTEEHACAAVAIEFFKLTNAQWNGPSGPEYYAAVLACSRSYKLFS